jgi:hypothetical protein
LDIDRHGLLNVDGAIGGVSVIPDPVIAGVSDKTARIGQRGEQGNKGSCARIRPRSSAPADPLLQRHRRAGHYI